MEKADDNVVANTSGDFDTAKPASKLEIETAMPHEEVAAYFEALARGIRGQELTLRKGGEQVTIAVCGEARVAVKATSKKGAGRLRVVVHWDQE